MDQKGNSLTRGEEARAYWVLVLPAFLIYLFVMAFPTIISLVLSVSNYQGGKLFGGPAWGIVGFQEYTKLMGDPYFWTALRNNGFIVAVSVFGQIPLGFLFAYIIFRKLVKAPAFWQGVLYMPSIISTIVIGILWQTIFSPYGPLVEFINSFYKNDFFASVNLILQQGSGVLGTDGINSILALADPEKLSRLPEPVKFVQDQIAVFGGDLEGLKNGLYNLLAPVWRPSFLNQDPWAMMPVLFVILWIYTGFYLIIFLANMQKIDTSIIEAASIDGATESQVMRHIILPSLSGVIVTSAILAISGSLKSFDLIFAMTGGGPSRITQVLSIYMYDNAFRGAPKYPLANAISTVMIVISFGLIVITKAIEKRFGGKEE